MLRCLIVDDSDRFLLAARSVLEAEGIDVAGTASSAAQALRLFVELRPDVTLVDIGLGPESGFDLIERLVDVPGQAVAATILISTDAEDDYAHLIAASPAIGFLPKSQLSAAAIMELLSAAT